MNQIGFKGYAQSLGFDPIKAPDLASKELEQGKNEIRNMERKSESDLRVRQAYADSMATAYRQEADNRNENQNFETQWRRGYQEAINQNNRLKTANANQNVENVSNNFAALGALSQTAAKLATDYKAKKDEADEIYGQNYVIQNGITPKMAFDLETGEQILSQGETQLNAIANQAPNAEVRKTLKGLSGKKLYGAIKQLAIMGGQEYPIWMQENLDKEIIVGDRKTTLRDAQMGDPASREAAKTVLRNEYLKRFSGIDPAVANKYLYEDIRRFDSQDNAQYASQRGKALEAEEDATNLETLLTNMRGADKGTAVTTWILEQAGGDKTAVRAWRSKAMQLLTIAADSGRFTSQDLNVLLETPVSLGGAAPKPFGDIYRDDVKGLGDAVKKFNRVKNQEAEESENERKESFLKQFTETQLALKRNFTEAEIKAFSDGWMREFGEQPPSELQGYKTNEVFQKQLGEKNLEYLYANGLLTSKELRSGKYADTQIIEWETRAAKGDAINKVSSDARKNYDNQLAATLKGALGNVPGGANQNASYFPALETARRDVLRRAQGLMETGANPDTAYAQAVKEVSAEIERGKTGQGTYRVNGTIGADGKFKAEAAKDKVGFQLAGDPTGALAGRTRLSNMKAELRKNPGLISSKKFLLPEEAQQLASGQGIPPILEALARVIPGADVIDIANAQLGPGVYNLKPLQRTGANALVDMVSPEVRRMLTNRSSPIRAITALNQTFGNGQNAYRPLLDLISSQESSNDKAGGGYDAFNTGGSAGGTIAYGSGNTFRGQKISQMTVGQVMDLQANNDLHATGRYQIIRTTLRGLVQAGIATREELYSPEVQDRLGIALIKRRSNRFFNNEKGVGDAVAGMGAEWIGLRKVPPQKLQAALELTKASLQNANFDTTGWRTGVVYKVGGQGPKGPKTYGPHIDAKMTDNAYFDRNYLDNYIEVNPGSGWMPVSAGPTVKGGEFGASRDGGTRPHTGWDYAFPEGAQVRLKNGARVVGKRETAWGTQLSIALRDGRTVQFLHGKG